MRLQATVSSVIEDCGELSIKIRGWSKTEPPGTYSHPLGTLNVLSNARNRRAYYIGRQLIIDVRPK
jgi:hypothetical protein